MRPRAKVTIDSLQEVVLLVHEESIDTKVNDRPLLSFKVMLLRHIRDFRDIQRLGSN